MSVRKILITTILCLVALPFSRAEDFESGGISYRVLSDGRVAVTEQLTWEGRNAYEGVLIVPENVYYNGVTRDVTAVDAFAFSASGVTEVILPGSVRWIGESAFADATSLTDVTLPIHINAIPRYCFAGTAVSDVAIPEGVTQIGYGAFQECTRLNTVFLPSTLRRIDDLAFDWCYNLEQIYCAALLPPRLGDDVFADVRRADLIVTDDAAVDLYEISRSEWSDDKHFTVYPDEDIDPLLSFNPEPFEQDWLDITLGNHLAYTIYGEDGEPMAYTAAAHFYLPATDHDALFTVVPTTAMTDAERAEVVVEALNGIDRIIEEPMSPIPDPIISARDGQIHVWGDNYRRVIRVFDIYGMMYFERFSDGGEIIELPRGRIYIVTVDDYVKKVML